MARGVPVSASERTKGAVGEREVVALLREAGWLNAARTSDGRNQGGRGDLLGGPSGYVIEVKRQERLNVPQALRRLALDAGGAIPLLVHRSSRQEWLVTMAFEDLLPLLRIKESL